MDIVLRESDRPERHDQIVFALRATASVGRLAVRCPNRDRGYARVLRKRPTYAMAT